MVLAVIGADLNIENAHTIADGAPAFGVRKAHADRVEVSFPVYTCRPVDIYLRG